LAGKKGGGRGAGRVCRGARTEWRDTRQPLHQLLAARFTLQGQGEKRREIATEARIACPPRINVAPFFQPLPVRTDLDGRPERCGIKLLQQGPQGCDGGPRWIEERSA